jgi:glutamyl-tRNA synthetase
MHWLPADADTVEVEVLMPDKKLVKGVGESALKDLSVGTMVQLERFGFCRLDRKEKNKVSFWFAHK